MIGSYLERVAATKGIPEIIALGIGAYKGFCDAQQILLHPEIINKSLVFVPTAVHTALGGFIGLMEGVSDEDNDRYYPFVIKEGLVGAATGVVETGIGYCIGHTLGSLLK